MSTMSFKPTPEAAGPAHSGRVALVAVIAAFGGFLFGFDTSVINGAVNALRAGFGMSEGLTGFSVSCALLGCMVGAWFAGGLADRYGRVRSMIVAAALFFVSALGSGLAPDVLWLIVWRVVGGLGVGMASVIAPAYIAEVSPARVRGQLGSLWQLAIVAGIFVALLSDAYLAQLAGGAGAQLWFGLAAWRWMFIAEAVPSVLYGIMAFAIPESPRYLVARGKLDRAARVLREIVGLKGGESAEAKIAQIQSTITTEKRQTLRDLIGANGRIMPIVWIGIALAVFQQFVGINVIFYYSSTLWQAVGFAESDSMTITVITSVTNIVVTVVAIASVDRVGRRPLLIAGSAGMAVSLGVMALCFAQAVTVDGKVSLPGAWGITALIAANLFVIFFGATWGPIMWLMLGEMFPNRIRAVALSAAAAVNWLANFAISTLFPAMADFSLAAAYGFYAVCSLLSLFFVLKWVPETKGVELEEMTEGAHTRAA
ncbi:sugar porter family MFS transporter [Brevibacterium sp. BRM-1]|uniref:sugar porter family MFS transporter n=1 Tax=Brevibacterium sp. BRM-1 TaxID=2999062 RepID=UPI003FA4CB8F